MSLIFKPAGGGGSGSSIGEGTGVLTGGIMSAGAGATEYSISDGTGQIVTKAGVVTAVSWSGKTNITPTNIGTQNITFVAINSAGTVIESTARFTNTERRTLIVLGVAVHVDRVNVDTVNNEQNVAYNAMSQMYDLFEAIGFFNVSGNVFSANGANLNVNKSAGQMFAAGSNYPTDLDNPHPITLAVLTALTFQYRFSDGSNGTTGIVIDPANIDNGSGGLTALTNNNKWSVQRIYSFTSNNVKIQRGQAEYSTQDQAIAGIVSEAFVTEPSIAANGLLRGFLVMKKSATALDNSTQAVFVSASKFQASTGGVGSLAETLQQVYENSTPNPEILTDSTGGAFTVRRGSAADTDNIYEGQNNAGTTNFAVTGDGDVTSAKMLVKGKLLLNTSVNLQISSGAITLTSANHTIEPETGTTDTLTDINGIADGEFTIIRPTDDGDIITIVGTGNIHTPQHLPIVLEDTESYAIVFGRGTAAIIMFVADGRNQIGTRLPVTLTPTGTTQTIDWDVGNAQVLDLGSSTGDVTLTLTNAISGYSYQLKIIQGATARDVVFPSTVTFPGETAPTTIDISSGNNEVDVVTLTFYNTDYVASHVQNFG